MSQILNEVLSANAACAGSLVPSGTAIYGYVFDVKAGALVEVREATRMGAAMNPRN